MTTLPQYDYTSKTVLITGAATGIGRAAALAFAGAGARLTVAMLEGQDAALEKELLAAGATAVRVHPTDVRKEEDISALVAAAIEGSGSIDIAFNNAGIEGPFGPLHELDTKDYDNLVGTNMRGVWLSMKYQLRHMAPRGQGVIINTASTAGIKAIPQVAAYSATKHGIIGLTRGAALEQAANGIRINAIAPGPVDTGLLSRMIEGQIPMDALASAVPQQRISQPDEIAQAVLWLASDAARYITGETLVIDGGLTQS